MPKADQKDKPKIEAAMGKYCANEDGKLSAKEKKICYYIDPMYVFSIRFGKNFSVAFVCLFVCLSSWMIGRDAFLGMQLTVK